MKQILSNAFVFQQRGRPSQVVQLAKIKHDYNPSTQLSLELIAAPINPSDINMIEGTYPIQPIQHPFGYIPGQEGLFRINESQIDGFPVGGWVIPHKQGFNTWQTKAVCKPDECIVLDSNVWRDVSPLYAATVSVNPPTGTFVSLLTK
jgi:trans-2-enoyl-CoA reductase